MKMNSKIAIWDKNIPYNSGKSKYEDIPYLTPFLVKGSNQAVIIVPGGGYAYKSSDYDGTGKQGEGDLIAKKLNEAGISAFVLWYRSNPYRMPVPLLDVQRAVRYVRYHAKEYEIDPKKIGIVGFSAGGFQVAGLINLLRNERVLVEGYEEDEIDHVSDRVALAGLIYPCINFKYNIPMMFSAFPADQIRNRTSREALLERYDCMKYVQEKDPPQFICYGSKDFLVNPEQSERYVEILREKGVPYQKLIIEGANHGFGACANVGKKFAYWLDEFVDWIGKQLTEE